MSLAWIDPDGTVWPFDAGETVEALAGLSGTGMPRQDQVRVSDAAGHGSTLIRTRHATREVAVPVKFDRYDAGPLAAALDPTRGDGRLQWVDPDDAHVRELVCRYASGLEISHDLPARRVAVLLFVTSTPDPFWRDASDQTATYELGDVGLWLPWPPVSVVPDDVLATPTVQNTGDVEAWPVWTITGPATSVTLANQTTGRSLTVDTVLTAGETLEIDTRPGAKTVTDAAGTNRFAALAADDDDLWPLPPGASTLAVSIVSATAASRVQLAWARRWLAA